MIESDSKVESYLRDMSMAAWRLPAGGLSEGYGHGGPGVCLGDGQTEAYLKDIGISFSLENLKYVYFKFSKT